MGHKFANILFSPTVKAVQKLHGSRESYARWENGSDYNHEIDENVAAFLAERDSFYMASVNADGWPYLQHRGGSKGFMRVLSKNRIGFADYSGNRQYISTGNFQQNNRVALFFMDYPNQRRLKILGRVKLISAEDIEQLALLEDDNYQANVERGFIIHIEAFDWNCPQHITPRYDQENLMQMLAQFEQQLSELEQQQTTLLECLGEGELSLVISGIRQLTPNVRAYELRHSDGKALPEFTAGAHLQIPVPGNNAEATSGHYSISNSPNQTGSYEIAVLNTGGSKSAAIHQQFTLGLKLNCPPPQNHFELQPHEGSVVLIAAGIGITPLKAMAIQLLTEDRDFTLHYVAKNPQYMAYADELQQQLKDHLVTYYSECDRRLNLTKIFKQLDNNSHVYLCGPNGLLDSAIQVATEIGIDLTRVHFERFSPIKHTTNETFKLHLKKSNKTVSIANNDTALQAVLDAGINVNFGCKTGQCGNCAVSYSGGEVEHRDEVLTESERERLMCLCVSRASGENLSIDL